MAKRDCRPTEMPPATTAFAKARNLGRAVRVVFRVGGRVALVVYNVYGFPGAIAAGRRPPAPTPSWKR